MAQELETSITYYVSRLIYQYSLPNAKNTIAILIKQMLLDGLPWQLNEAFNLSTAVGAQLDILGKYIGLPRNVGDPAAKPFFGFVRYSGVDNNPNGFTNYEDDENGQGVFYRYGYSGTNASDLTDTAYLYLMLFKIFLNNSDSTLYGIQKGLLQFFGTSVRVVDNKNMTLTYYVSSGIPVSPSILLPFLPRPMGVGITSIIESFSIITDTGDNIVTDTGDTIVAGNP